MTFQAVKTALQALLTANASTNFVVVGAEGQGKRAEDLFTSNKGLVQVFFSGVEWDQSSSPRLGKAQGTATFKILLTIAQGTLADVATLNDPSSTGPQIITALAAVAQAESVADAAWDTLYSQVWNIVRNPANRNFGVATSTFLVSDNWIANARKGDPLRQGEVVVISGTMNLTCKIVEYPASASETAGLAIDTIFAGTIDKTATATNGVTQPFGTPITDPKFDPAKQGAKVGT